MTLVQAGTVHAADKTVEEIKEAGGEAIANHDSVATMAGGENIVKLLWMLMEKWIF